jgi:DNA invertase Pin-like site-specific DNA recombinase
MKQQESKNSSDQIGCHPQQQAVAYYRQASQSKQDNSIAIQQKQVQTWAAENGLIIIKEFCDKGKSGLTAEGRPAFMDLIENWVKKRNDFKYILCLEITRWGRFIDINLSKKYSSACKLHNKKIIYTTLGARKDRNGILIPKIDRTNILKYRRYLVKRLAQE